MSGRRLFRTLLRLLPFDFRADYGREIERTFHEQRRDAHGRAGRARVWAETVSALMAVGPREHLAQPRSTSTASCARSSASCRRTSSHRSTLAC